MKRINYYFASANTGDGFKNHFNSITENKNKEFQIILKGGPGTGKSSFMKKIGKYFSKKNYHIEYFVCSSDTNSLDGVRIVEKNISIIDGTSPHSDDASFPNVNKKIINLGDCISPSVKKYKEQIFKEAQNKQKNFDIAYQYLHTIKSLRNINKNIYKNKTNQKLIKNKIKYFLIKNNFKIINNNLKCDNNRDFYLKIISLNSIYDLLNKNYFSNILFFNIDFSEELFLPKQLANKLNQMGYKTISFHNFIDDNVIEKIYIPQKDLLINFHTTFEFASNESLDIIHSNNIIINQLLNKTSFYLSKAKEHHMKLEKFFTENLNFTKLNKITKNTISYIKNAH